MQIALLGNPNTGKTSLFNALTNSYEYVGNWSGVTVEKKVGQFVDQSGQLIDLPGVYSLNPISKDETVVTNYLLEDTCEGLINIIDAAQLRRNLHLTLQLRETGNPVIVGLNMVDVAKNRGITIHTERLAQALDLTVMPIVARTGQGIDMLLSHLPELKTTNQLGLVIDYGAIIEHAIAKITNHLSQTSLNKRWLALQFLEGNHEIEDYLTKTSDITVMQQIRLDANKEISASSNRTLEHVIYQYRDQFIDALINSTVCTEKNQTTPLSERIDRIVTNRYLGIPIFLSLMYIMFMLTFDWLGFPISDLLDAFFSGPLTSVIQAGLNLIGASSFIEALIIDGIISGVGGVLVFVPQIFILFFFISLLEDSGYMARVATVMDRIMQSVGLNGKAFIPMIISFGCNVPGVMAARTIEQPKERLITTLLTPLMSCSARLPVYALFVGAFFSQHQALIVLSLYVLGVVVAFILAFVFSKTLFKNEQSFFIVELPPYRLPQWKTLSRSTWDKGKGFVKKAGTFIFAGSVFIWLLSYSGPGGVDVAMDESFLAMIGGIFAPLLIPLGFGTWQAAAALLTGFLAKEIVVATMAIIYVVPETGMQEVLQQAFTPVSAYSFMVFILLYVPCLATVAAINKETQSKRLAWFSIGYAFILAYLLSFIINQVGSRII